MNNTPHLKLGSNQRQDDSKSGDFSVMGKQKPYQALPGGLLTLAQAASITGYHQDYLGQLIRSGKLEGQKLGRNWVTTLESLGKILVVPLAVQRQSEHVSTTQASQTDLVNNESLSEVRQVHVDVQDQLLASNSEKVQQLIDKTIPAVPRTSNYHLDHKGGVQLTNTKAVHKGSRLPILAAMVAGPVIIILAAVIAWTNYDAKVSHVASQAGQIAVLRGREIESTFYKKMANWMAPNIFEHKVTGGNNKTGLVAGTVIRNEGAAIPNATPVNHVVSVKSDNNAKQIEPSVYNYQPMPAVLGVSTDDVLATLRTVLVQGLPSDLLSQLKGVKGDKGDPGLATIPNSGTVFGLTTPTAQNPGSIGSVTYLSSREFITDKLTVTGASTMIGLDCTGFINGGALTANASGNLVCADDDGGALVGDSLSIGGVAATDGNFVNTIASGTVPSIIWNLEAAASPDAISILSIGGASDTEAGIVTTGLQTFAGNKIFNGTVSFGSTTSFQANDIVDAEVSDTLTASNLVGTGSSTDAVDLGTAEVAGTLSADKGGTGQVTYAIGDILYASGATTLSKLSDIVTGNVLISGGVGVAPSWGKVVLGTHTTGNYVSDLIGTVNQISVSSATGSVTLSIPSDFRAPGTVNAVSGIYTGAVAGTQRIDASGNLVNIGNITATRLDVTGLTLNTDVNNAIMSANFTGSLTKDDTNLRVFSGISISPTINTGVSNTQTTFNVLNIDTTNTAVTGVTTNLIKASYGGSAMFTVRGSDGMTTWTSNGSRGMVFAPGNSNTFSAVGDTNTTSPRFRFGSRGAMNATTGTQILMTLTNDVFDTYAFAPISGTTDYSALAIITPINQTGGANGVTRGIYINPTLTSAADYRAIEITGGRSVFTATQSAVTSGSPTAFTINGGAHTTLTASTEATDINFNLNRTVQFAAGSLVDQRAMRIQAPTYAFASASTITNAATMSISGAPIAGANATITNSAALVIESGNVGIGTAAPTSLLHLSNATNPTIRITDTTNTAIAVMSASDTSAAFGSGSNHTLNIVVNSGTRLGFDTLGNAAFTTATSSSNTVTAFSVTPGTRTNAPAGVEMTDINFNLARNVTFATGALATQRAFRIQAPTYAFVGASTLTNAATLSISGAPIAGTNATITNGYALEVEAGNINLGTAFSGTYGYAFQRRTDRGMFLDADSNTLILQDTNDVRINLDSNNNTAASTFVIAQGGSGSVGGTAVLSIIETGNTTLAQRAQTASSPTILTVTGGAHTTLTASTEATDVNFNLARTVEFSTGALATQRAMRIQAPTYAFVGASTITDAATLSISGAPAVGTNATITNAYALNVESGSVRVGNLSGGGTLCLQTNNSGVISAAASVCGASGDNITVNSSAAADANFLNVTATGILAGTTWTLNGASTPNDITLAISTADATTAGIVNNIAQTFGGVKTFNSAIAANGGITFDSSTDTIGAFTAGGTIAMGTQSITGTTGIIDYTYFDVNASGQVTSGYLNSGNGNTIGLATLGTAIGYSNTLGGFISGPVAIGNTNTVSSSNAIAIGTQNSVSSGTESLALGRLNVITTAGGMAFGLGNSVSGPNGMAIGLYTQASAQSAIALGLGVNSTTFMTNSTTDSLGIGFNSTVPTFVVGPASGAGTYGTVDMFGDTTIKRQADLRFADSDSTNWVAFQSAAVIGSNVTWTLPSADSSGCFQSNGAGVVSIAFCGASGDNISVNSSAAADANFLNVTATGILAGTTWTLNGASTPNDITLAISTADATTAGIVNNIAQTFAGLKTFQGITVDNAAADGAIAGAVINGTITTTDATTETYHGLRIAPTVNTPGNSNKTFNVLSIDVTVTDTTGTDTYLINASEGGLKKFSVKGSDGTVDVLSNGSRGLRISPGNLNMYQAIGGSSTVAGARHTFSYGGNLNATTGSLSLVAISDSPVGQVAFAPTSGTADYSALAITTSINQTGGANGATRGIYINPTLTSAADFRAIEITGGRSVFTATQSAVTSGSPTALTVTAGAHTTLTASAEATDINFNLARTVQFATGALATQRAMRIQAPTYSFVAASVLTNAATLSISGAPVAGTNATITNPAALLIESGNSGFGTLAPKAKIHASINGGALGYTPGADTALILSKNGSSADSVALTLSAGSAGSSTINFASNAENESGYIRATNSNGSILIAAGSNTQGVYLAGGPTAPNSGSVGIGTSSPVLGGGLTIAPVASNSGSPSLLTVTAPAHTTLAASTEATDINFNLARTVEFAAGNIVTQRAMRIQAPTYSFVGASTIAAASTLSISGAPIAGANATLTGSYALNVESGLSKFGGSIVIDEGNNTSAQLGLYDGGQVVVTIGDGGGATDVGKIRLHRSGINNLELDGTGWMAISQLAQSNTTPTAALTITGGAHTTLTASTEATDVNFNLARTVEFSTGALATQRAMRIQAPTYGFVGASTITNASTLSISGAPAEGANSSITNSHGLYIESGAATGAANAFGLTVMQPTGAGSNYVAKFSDGTITSAIYAISNYVAFGTLTNHDLRLLVDDASDQRGITIETGSGNVGINDTNPGSQFSIIQPARSGANITPAFTLTGGAHTNITASTEATDINFNLARTVEFAAGNIVTQRAMRIQAPTYSFVGASTITNASTLSISGAPVAGTNATITNSAALIVESGRVGIGTPSPQSLLHMYDGAAGSADPRFYMGASTVAHGVTGEAPASVFGILQQESNGSGGLKVMGITDTGSGGYGLRLIGVLGSTDPEDNRPAVIIEGSRRSGPSRSAMGDLETILRVDSSTTVTGLFTIFGNGSINLASKISTTGSPTALTVSPGAHTTLTASTEATDVNFNLARTVEFSTGALATQRAMRIQAPTYSFVGASTLTNAATLSISGAPIAGANATITNSAALVIESGNVGIGTAAPTTLLHLSNATNPTIQVTDTTNTAVAAMGATDTSVTFGSGTNHALNIIVNASARLAFDNLGNAAFTTATSSSSTVTAFSVTPGTRTNAPAGVEMTDINFNLARNVTFATGALATQRAFRIQAPTYSFVGASTITSASTLAISGAPIAGANATLTGSYALNVEGGDSRFAGNIILPTTDSFVGRDANNAYYPYETGGGSKIKASGEFEIVIDSDNNATSRSFGLMRNNGTDILRISESGASTLTQQASTSVSPTILTVTGGAHTTLTASTEATDVNFNLARTVEFSTGALATQRAMRIQAPTYSFVGASTITDAASFYIDAAPTAGINATITNPYSLFIDAGNVRMDGLVSVGLGTTSSTSAVCSSLGNASAPSAGTAYELRDCDGTPAADYSESYPAAPDVDEGDLVMPTGTTVITTQGDQVAIVAKAESSLGLPVIGVISRSIDITDFNHIGNNIKESDNPKPVALNGRVLVKISKENGQIAIGDRLTLSKTLPGFAMKQTESGDSIGVALQASSSGSEKIMVFLKLGYQPLTIAQNSSGQIAVANGDHDMRGFAILNLKAISSVNGKWSINENGELVVETIKAQQLCLDDVCINKDQLKAILDNNGGIAPAAINAPAPEAPSPFTTGPVPMTPSVDLEQGMPTEQLAQPISSAPAENPTSIQSTDIAE